MEAIEKVKEFAVQAVAGAQVEIINSTPAAQQPALLVDREHVYAVAKFLKEDPQFQMDFCSCVTGVDYLPKGDKPGCIEVVYHLYSVALKHGPDHFEGASAARTRPMSRAVTYAIVARV